MAVNFNSLFVVLGQILFYVLFKLFLIVLIVYLTKFIKYCKIKWKYRTEHRAENGEGL